MERIKASEILWTECARESKVRRSVLFNLYSAEYFRHFPLGYRIALSDAAEFSF